MAANSPPGTRKARVKDVMPNLLSTDCVAVNTRSDARRAKALKRLTPFALVAGVVRSPCSFRCIAATCRSVSHLASLSSAVRTARRAAADVSIARTLAGASAAAHRSLHASMAACSRIACLAVRPMTTACSTLQASHACRARIRRTVAPSIAARILASPAPTTAMPDHPGTAITVTAWLRTMPVALVELCCRCARGGGSCWL